MQDGAKRGVRIGEMSEKVGSRLEMWLMVAQVEAMAAEGEGSL